MVLSAIDEKQTMSNTQIITKVLMALLFASLYSCDSEKYRIRKLFEEFEHITCRDLSGCY